MLILRQLLLLLWKGALLKKRHFIITILEIVIPMAVVALMCYIQTLTYPSSKREKQPAKVNPEEDLKEYFYSSSYFLYSPDNDVAAKLNNATLAKFDGTDFHIVKCKNKDDLFKKASDLLLDDNYYTVTGLVFDNLDSGQELPSSLSYTIRMSRDFYTESKYPPFTRFGYNAYKESGFASLQNAVDEAFLNLTSGNSTKLPSVQKKIQAMPNPSQYNMELLLSILLYIPMVLNQGMIFTVFIYVKRLVDEKVNRAKEMMKMMGMNDLVYFSGNCFSQFLVVMFIMSVALIFCKIPFSSGNPIIKYSDGFLVWVILLFYAVSCVLFCTFLSTLFNKPIVAGIITMILWNVTYFVPLFLMDPPMDTSKYLVLKRREKLGVCLLPNTALHFLFKIMAFYEAIGEGAQWNNMSKPASGDDVSLSLVLGMMIASCFIYATLIWYLDNVWPWQFGIPKHPLYFVMPSYWVPKKSKFVTNGLLAEDEDEQEENMVDSTYFEEEPQGKRPGIIISHLSKAFGWGSSRKLAVSDVSLNLYHGEITALLGHNGAGKTTTMNVITGLFPPSSGTAFVNGYDIRDHLKQARSSLGLCPQHNVLYDTLTVEEHLTFFAGLKGRTFAEMKPEIHTCLKLLQLEHKAKDLARTLSGGMKRKLSLGIAMIGESKVLILDEPTSGMDPQARRTIWDLLMRIKEDRTIVLTTHYMEEADILGDRIAIMAEGVVQCCGSPLFLKRKFGAGYHLRVSKGETFKEEKLHEIIQRSVPSAYVDSQMRSEIAYILPVNNSQTFADMFQALEARKVEIGFTACGLTITTMEDVFIKVGKMAEKALELSSGVLQGGESQPFVAPPKERLRGFPLWTQQMRGLLAKRMHDSKRYVPFLVFLILLPLAITFLMLFTRNSILNAGLDNTKALKLNLGEIFPKTEAFYMNTLLNGTGNEVATQLSRVYSEAGATPRPTTNITEAILNIGENDLQKYKLSLVVGGVISSPSDPYNPNAPYDPYNPNAPEPYDPTKFEFKTTSVYSTSVYHSLPISLNLMNVALHRAITGNKDANIQVTNSPLPNRWNMRSQNMLFLNPIVRIIMGVFIPLAMSFLSSSFVLFPIHERQNKSKLIQLMTGVDGLTFWISNFIWDFAMHFVVCCLMLIPFAVMDAFHALDASTGALGVLFALLVLYGWAAIPLSYIMSFISKKPSTGFAVVTVINFLTGTLACIGIGIYKSTVVGRKDVVDNSETAAWFIRIMPNFAVTWGAANLDLLSRNHVICRDPKADQTIPSNIDYSTLGCNTLLGSMDELGCGRDMLMMFIVGLVLFAILAVMETNLVRFWYRMTDKKQQQLQEPFPSTVISMNNILQSTEDSDVAEERRRVQELIQGGRSAQEALAVSDLTKYFGNINAVDHVTFAVHQDECFGLLGVNGAGKTTTFSMLTGDLTIGEGTAMIGQYSVKDDLKMFQQQIGYCPQFDAVLDRLTGRESLYLFARLRGLPEYDIPRVVDSIINVVDLQKHADKIAEKYSGGNRRKLSLALALVGSPPVVFLDEPTAGVDPASRRKIWNAFIQVQQTGGTSFILTTHSMEECEALCGRLVIMVNGQFRCLGPIQYLKSKFGQGYTIIVKLNKDSQDQQATEAVQQFFQTNFSGSVLKDYHEGMLHYHIADTRYSWSHLFSQMEQAKQTFNFEDYLISDTTLEQIFLAFARTQRIVVAT